MKKQLLLSAALIAAGAAFAAGPQIFEGAWIVAVSPDGSISVSEDYGNVKIYDNEDGKILRTFEIAEDHFADGYGLGISQPISKTNRIVGFYDNRAAYLSDLEAEDWTLLPIPDESPSLYSIAKGISADGTKIVGFIGMKAIDLEDSDVPMEVPVIWEQQEDGTFGQPTILPYPEKDYLGNVPQYVMAHCISADGKTIVGQVTDGRGFMRTLVYYTLNENNEWEMHNDFEVLANPNHVIIPPYPAQPEYPEPTNFMTEEEKAAYDEAYKNYMADWSNNPYPYPEDYMTEEEYAKYQEAVQAYNEEFEKWWEESDKWEEILSQAGGQDLVFNNVYMTPDGKTAVSTWEISSGNGGIMPLKPAKLYGSGSYTPVKFDLENNNYSAYPDENVLTTFVSDNGTILGTKQYDEDNNYISSAWVYVPEQATPVSILSYYQTREPELYDWMEKNMIHDIEVLVYDGDTDDWTTETVDGVACTGMPLASGSMKTVTCTAYNDWDESDYWYYSYLLRAPLQSGIHGIKTDALKQNINVYAERGGRVLVEGTADLQVIAADGRVVYDAKNVSGAVETGVAPGAYIVKANGKVLKVMM